ncbi:MAG: type II toxin-antitoxin system RelE/ParE family toxin [Bacteroidales bacterium]|nr:type II toxin-antitoxin system RelE/ParE family toxin [Bacteroidales bacterium]
MKHESKIKVKFLDEADSYLATLPLSVTKKFAHNIARVIGGEKDPEIFEKLNQDIWEFRVRQLGMAYRLLAFWDKNTKSLIVATHGFSKKTKKTPLREIAHATAIMKEYYSQK